MKDQPKKTEIPFTEFTDPSISQNPNAKQVIAKVYEPHDYNRKLLESQRARGVAANIPQVPSLGKTHTIAVKRPPQLDLVGKAQAILAATRAAEEQMGAEQDVLPGEGASFDDLA